MVGDVRIRSLNPLSLLPPRSGTGIKANGTSSSRELEEILKNFTLHKCNRSALLNCSLVCSTWREIVQPWICASITFYSEWPPYPCLIQTQAVFSACPFIPAYVRTLYIKFTGMGQVDEKLFRTMDELGIITALSGHVRCLILDFGYMVDGINEVFSDYLSKFSTVQHLRLSETTVPSYALLKSTFLLINRLSLDSEYFRDPFHLNDKTIKRLYIRSNPTIPPIMLPSGPGASGLIHLTLKWSFRSPADVNIKGDPPRELIDAIPANLKSLSLYGESVYRDRPGIKDNVLHELSFCTVPRTCYFFSAYVY
jgi:hypothetical protein